MWFFAGVLEEVFEGFFDRVFWGAFEGVFFPRPVVPPRLSLGGACGPRAGADFLASTTFSSADTS